LAPRDGFEPPTNGLTVAFTAFRALPSKSERQGKQ